MNPSREPRIRFQYDKSSRLIEHHADAILRLGGVTGVRWCRAQVAGLVQPRQLPDGLVEALLDGRPAPTNAKGPAPGQGAGPFGFAGKARSYYRIARRSGFRQWRRLYPIVRPSPVTGAPAPL